MRNFSTLLLLMHANYVPAHTRDHADAEYCIICGVGHKELGLSFLTNKFTYSHTNTQAIIVVQTEDVRVWVCLMIV